VLHKKVGDSVNAEEPLATLHFNDHARAERSARLITSSFEITASAPAANPPLIHRVIARHREKS
jgi:thymidine phosphorylase